MFYDLNVACDPRALNKDGDLARTLSFLAERYNVVALNHTITGKLPADLSCPIPQTLPFSTPPSLAILRRCTVTLSEPATASRLAQLSHNHDILALRPVDEKSFQHACSTLDCDLISLDLTQRLGFHFKFKTVSEAIKRGVRFEVCYSQGVVTGDALARRNLIGNVAQLVRATRGRGIVISSEARAALACRAPWDVVNLAAVWGLAQERGYEAVTNEARSVVASARLKRTSYRGVVDVVYGGEKPASSSSLAPADGQSSGSEKPKQKQGPKQKNKQTVVVVGGGGAGDALNKKRKVELMAEGDAEDKPLSKREQKRRAHQARIAAQQQPQPQPQPQHADGDATS